MARKGSAKSRVLSASSKGIDPILAALFEDSAKPIFSSKEGNIDVTHLKSRGATENQSDDDDIDEEVDVVSSEKEENNSFDDSEDDAEVERSDYKSKLHKDTEEYVSGKVPGEDDASVRPRSLAVIVKDGLSGNKENRKRKQKQREENELLEAKYFQRLEDEREAEEPDVKRLKNDNKALASPAGKEDEDSEYEDGVDNDRDPPGDAAPIHESLTIDHTLEEMEKAGRTVFLSNVSTEAVTSKMAKKTLLKHIATILDESAAPKQQIESIRFRSIAFSTSAIPKRASFVHKNLMEATTKSANAYVVFSHSGAVRAAISRLNGTVVLDRHLRVDSVAHPMPVHHKRCVFVGNLGFVDDETVSSMKVDAQGKPIAAKRKRTKKPMDVEEGLWRVFGEKAGKVESVRVVRDAATRVGKGFAYVQFYDPNHVEAALVLDGKSFSPLLPRALRVRRCRAPHKTARAIETRKNKAKAECLAAEKATGDKKSSDYAPKATTEEQTLAGRASKILGSQATAFLNTQAKQKKRRPRKFSGAGHVKRELGMKTREAIVFEGKRASAKDGKPKDIKFKGAKKAAALNAKGGKNQVSKRKRHSAARAAKWKSER